jgi:L-lactate dehydrogenase (cytochrome)
LRQLGINCPFFLPGLVIREEFETAMKNNGITSVSEASPELVNTGGVDHLVPAGRLHPYARKITRGPKHHRTSKI